jgi:hypothetical protein
MNTPSLVLSFLSGGAVGSLLTGFVSTSHERTERFRERMLNAAEKAVQLLYPAHIVLKATSLCLDAPNRETSSPDLRKPKRVLTRR